MFVDDNYIQIKTEVDSNDVTEALHDDMPSAGLHEFLLCSPIYKVDYLSIALLLRLNC